MTRKFGVLVEDKTDAAIIKAVVQRRLGNSTSVKPISGKGCARVRAKAERWIKMLYQLGYVEVIILHDLDREKEAALRAQLEAIPIPNGVQRLVCIPVEEVEAWFWSDPKVVTTVGRGAGKASPSPHLIKSPKEKLMKLSQGSNAKPRYSTEDNGQLAEILDLELCAERCPSFRQLLDYLGAAA